MSNDDYKTKIRIEEFDTLIECQARCPPQYYCIENSKGKYECRRIL